MPKLIAEYALSRLQKHRVATTWHVMPVSARIAEATTTKDPDTVKPVYEDWAQRYDDDITRYGYVAPV